MRATFPYLEVIHIKNSFVIRFFVCAANTYRPHCSLTCGKCILLYGENCHHITGRCPRGCAYGFQMDLCNNCKCNLGFVDVTLQHATLFERKPIYRVH